MAALARATLAGGWSDIGAPAWLGLAVRLARAWAADHGRMHIGGTMRPTQNIPEGFSPFYVEFDEEPGGYNFGCGKAQLDFKQMKFAWASG